MRRVTVIGAGVCGLLAALLLEKRNGSVLLVDENGGEPSPFDLPYICSNLVSNFLKTELPDVWADLTAAEARQISIAEILRARFSSPPVTPMDESTSFLCCSRTLLQRTLLEHVKRSKIQIERARVTKLIRTNVRVTGVQISKPGATPATIESDLVVDTSGAGVSRQAWLDGVVESFENFGPRYTSIAKFFRHDGPRELVQFDLASGENFRGGIYPLEKDRFAIALIVPENVAITDAEAFFDSAIERIPGAKLLLSRAVKTQELQRISGLRNRSSNFYEATGPGRRLLGFLPIGDSILSSNPIYGRGISLAVIQLKALIDALDTAEPTGPIDLVSLHGKVAAGVKRSRRFWIDGAMADRGEDVSTSAGTRALRFMRNIYVATVIPQLATNPDLTRRFLYNYQLQLPAWRITGPREYWTALTKLSGMSR